MSRGLQAAKPTMTMIRTDLIRGLCGKPPASKGSAMTGRGSGAPAAGEEMMPPLEATVLVIEDADSIAQLVQLYLAEAGARVLLAQDGVAGLRLFEHERPALVILDLMLPGLD